MIDGYCAIGEAARLTGLSVKTIRYYANEGVVSPSIVSDNGYRLYSPSDLWRLGLVRLLRQLEFGLPEIRKILDRSLDVPEIILWQREVLDLQIRHLVQVRTLLDRIPADTWGVESLVHLHTILEAMQMSKEQKEDWLTEHWSSAMIPDDAPESWRQSFLNQIKDSLPDDLSVEQAHAWGELQTLLTDPQFQNDMQKAVRPFWTMVDQQSMQPDEWTRSSGGILDRATEANAAGLDPDDPKVQEIVEDWIALFAKALHMPVTPEFVQRFSQYAEQMNTEPSKRLWDIMLRLNPEKLQPGFRAQQLMQDGLRHKLSSAH